MSVIYKKISNLLRDPNVQSINHNENLNNLICNFEEVGGLLKNYKILNLSEITDLKRFERCGIIIKQLIKLIFGCLNTDLSKSEIPSFVEKMYKVTYGNLQFERYDILLVKDTITTLNNELLKLLLEKIKEIDCNIYLGWAEINDKDNFKISLQRSIGNDCYFLNEFLKENVQLFQCHQLIECLQVISSKPEKINSNSILSLQELCHNFRNGKKECMKELLERYNEWDSTMLEFIQEFKELLNKTDCLLLLEYLQYIYKNTEKNELQLPAYIAINNIILIQSIQTIYEIVVEHITQNNYANPLETVQLGEAFKNFIFQNQNFRSSRSLRIILLFCLQNPKKIMAILFKISLGFPNYENIMILPNDLLLLRPIMNIKENANETFFTNILRSIILENTRWNLKKFGDFIKVMLDNCIINWDDLMNYIFIPYLENEEFIKDNLICILHNIRRIQCNCTDKTNVEILAFALAKRMSAIRKYTDFSIYGKCNVFALISRILDYFLGKLHFESPLRRNIADKLKDVLQPIDRPYYALLWTSTLNQIPILDIIQNYSRHCFFTMEKLKQDPNTSDKFNNENIQFTNEDFLRFIIINSTEQEYLKLGYEVTIKHWPVFGWKDEIEASDAFLRLTIEACCLSLEYPNITSSDTFPFLIKCSVHFARLFLIFENMKKTNNIISIVYRNMNVLSSSIETTIYQSLYLVLMSRLNELIRESEISEKICNEEIIQTLENFSTQCLNLNDECTNIKSSSSSSQVFKIHIIHKAITICMDEPMTEDNNYINQLDKLFDPEIKKKLCCV
ncbi:uncharacterized protein [Prorops nasuta]